MLSEGGIGTARVLAVTADDSVVKVQPAQPSYRERVAMLELGRAARRAGRASTSGDKSGTHRIDCSRELQTFSINYSTVPVY